MTPVEHDVYLCCRDAEERGMVSAVADGLTRLGFRVCVAGREPGAAQGPGRLAAIEKAPDFVLLSSPAPGGPPGSGPDPRAADLAHAFKTRRNILVLADPAHEDPLAAAEPPGRPRLAAWQRVAYDPARTRESIALVGHRLLTSSEVDDRRLMRRAKWAFAALGLILAIAVASRAVPLAVHWWNRPAAPPPLPRFTLYWSAAGQRLQNGQWTAFSIADGSAVAGGDRIRLAFSVGSDGYAYVVVRDAQGGVSLLHPGVTLRGASRVRAGSVYLVPGDSPWFPVDARADLAAIYLFAGHEPLENLEELLEEPEGGVKPAARLELLTSTLAGLLDGKHGTAQGPFRSRGGREIVDGLQPVPPPAGWPASLTGGSGVPRAPAIQTGLLSAVVEIRIASGTQD
ncbi:MAG: DUF4384 domain-containing protein [Vicinamibacterales bacterium]|jgi:hypothetical protein|nr:DUF4384 domain-containing protein [Vicinamibacterales bacterium]